MEESRYRELRKKIKDVGMQGLTQKEFDDVMYMVRLHHACRPLSAEMRKNKKPTDKNSEGQKV